MVSMFVEVGPRDEPTIQNYPQCRNSWSSQGYKKGVSESRFGDWVVSAQERLGRVNHAYRVDLVFSSQGERFLQMFRVEERYRPTRKQQLEVFSG